MNFLHLIQNLNLSPKLLQKVQEAFKIAKGYNINSIDDLKKAVLDFGGKEAVQAGLRTLENSKVSSVLSKFVNVSNLQELGNTIITDNKLEDKSINDYRERLKKL